VTRSCVAAPSQLGQSSDVSTGLLRLVRTSPARSGHRCGQLVGHASDSQVRLQLAAD
jgi:hypothetical protein